MASEDPNWPRLLSLAVHEFRTPVTVVAGYLRMLLRDRAGALTDPQRRLIEEAEKSCGRLSTLLGEMSELGQLADGRQTLAQGTADLGDLLRSIQTEAPTAENLAALTVQPPAAPMQVAGDAVRLQRAIAAIVFALRREIIDDGALIVSATERSASGRRIGWIAVGTGPVEAELRLASADTLGPFDEWRGGCGLSLPLSRCIVEMHGGRVMALRGERQKAGGVIELPLA